MKNPPDISTISDLKKGVELKLGFDITSTRDCEVLSMEIERFDRRFSLSVSTLRRFFGLIAQKNQYSLSTLNSLARFTGFTSFRNWEETRDNSDNVSKENSLLYKVNPKSDSKSVDNTIASLNDMVDTLIRNPSFRLSAAQLKGTKDAATMLFRLQAMPEWLWKKTNRHPIARLLIDSYPPLDYLTSFGVELMKDYFETSTSDQEKMFSKGLILLSELWKGEETTASLKDLPPVLKLSQDIHPMPQARLLGLNLLALTEGVKSETNTSVNFRTLIYEGINNEDVIWPIDSVATCPFIIKIIEWVTLSNDLPLCEEVIFGVQNYRTRQGFESRRYKIDNVLDLRLSWCFYLTGRELEARALLDSLSPDIFPQHEERTLLIWYHSLIQKIGGPKRRKSSLVSLDLLTSQTGYYGLTTRLNLLTP
jgi:hypothetical protein